METDGIKLLDDQDVLGLFNDNSDNYENQEDEIKQMSSEEATEMFSGKKQKEKDDDDDNDDYEEEEKVEEKPIKKEKAVEQSEPDYKEIAKQLVEEFGLDDELDEVDEFSLKKLIRKAIANGIDEETKQVQTAIENGVNAKDIQEFKNTIEYLHQITEEQLYVEDAEGDLLRRKLIVQNFLNQGKDEKEAVDLTNEIFKKGKDIEEAKKALTSNREYFGKAYKELLDESKKKADDWDSSVKKQTEELKDAIFSDEKYLGEIEIDDKTKRLALRNISEPMYRDKETGIDLTPIQKYEKENKTGFLKNLSLLFTLTDGFKNLDKVIEKAVKKKVSKEIENVEDVLKSPSGSTSNLSMVRSGGSNRLHNFKFDI